MYHCLAVPALPVVLLFRMLSTGQFCSDQWSQLRHPVTEAPHSHFVGGHFFWSDWIKVLWAGSMIRSSLQAVWSTAWRAKQGAQLKTKRALGVKLLSRLILLALNIQCFEGEIPVGWVCILYVVVYQADMQNWFSAWCLSHDGRWSSKPAVI